MTTATWPRRYSAIHAGKVEQCECPRQWLECDRMFEELLERGVTDRDVTLAIWNGGPRRLTATPMYSRMGRSEDTGKSSDTGTI